MFGKLIRAHVNPLAFPEVDFGEVMKATPDVESILRFICAPGVPSDVATLLARYREIAKGEPLSIVPDEQRVVDKLVAPLRHAKASYMVGNYLGTIALGGMVAEMLAILLWDLAGAELGGKPMTVKDEDALFGSAFEKLGQDRRVRVLDAYGQISVPVKADFDLLRSVRRKYLHLWSQDHDRLPADAIEVYRACLRLVAAVFGQSVVEGKIVLTPQLMKYLERHGLVEDLPGPPEASTDGPSGDQKARSSEGA